MKHLYSLVFALVALTCSHQATAQIIPNVTTTNDNNFTCSGTASAAPTGGAGGYAYLWSTGETTSSISNLCAGNYQVIIQDLNQDTASVFFTITNPCSNIALSASVTNVTIPGNCDGAIQATVTGGTGPYAFSLSGGSQTGQSLFSNLCAGTYTVNVVDPNGCTAVATATVNDPCSNIAVSTSVTNCTPGNCDGTLQFAVTGATGSYTYTVSGGVQMGQLPIPNLCPGNYTVTVVDANGCSAVATATVIELCSNLTVSASVTNISVSGTCDGMIQMLPTGGTAPYQYSASGSPLQPSAIISNLCIGTYQLYCQDALGCIASVNATVLDSSFQNPCSGFTGTTSAVFTSNPVTCDGSASVIPVNGTAPYTYTWSNGATTESISNLCSGTYMVTLEDSNACGVTLTVFVYDSIGTISNLSANLNTADDYTGNCDGSASITPTGGIAPYSVLWSNGQGGGSISNLCAGIYSVTIWDSGSDSTTVNFIIADSSTTYGNNPFPNVTINDTLYTELVTNCVIDYSTIDSASLYQAVYDTINQNLYVTWAVYSPTDTVYISDTLGLAGLPPGYYGLTISVYCPNKSGNDFFKIESVIYFDGTNVWMSTLAVDEHALDHVSIYPNPFIHSILIDNKDGVIQSMKLVDLNGRVLSEIPSVNSGMVKMDQLESISSGTYLLILSGENSSKAYKVIK